MHVASFLKGWRGAHFTSIFLIPPPKKKVEGGRGTSKYSFFIYKFKKFFCCEKKGGGAPDPKHAKLYVPATKLIIFRPIK